MDIEQGEKTEAEASNEEAENVAVKVDSEKVMGRRSIYVECSNACRCAIWTYLLADLREMAEKGELDEDAAEKLVMPVTVNELLEVFTNNVDKLKNYIGKDTDLYLSSVVGWVGRDQEALLAGTATQSSAFVFMDDYNKESECVYVIALIPLLKRVVVSFRGSVTPKDWMIDAQTVLRDVPNPVYDLEEGQPEYIGIHHGFFGTFSSCFSWPKPTIGKMSLAH